MALHCLGGFVVAVRYGLSRPTADLDYLEVIPARHGARLQELAGLGSALARAHGLYLQHVTVASLPERYEERLTPLWPGRFARLALFTLAGQRDARIQESSNRGDGIPVAGGDWDPKEAVECADVADSLHLAPVPAEDEPVIPRDDLQQFPSSSEENALIVT